MMTIGLIAMTIAAAGAEVGEDATGPTAALLFSYEVTDRVAFERGYKEHLEWHRSKNDHLTWYGWLVIGGSRVGAFVDGTFGAPFEAIDRRPDLKGDAQHMAEHVLPYAKPTDYQTFALWTDPSTSFTLEKRQPSAMLDAYYVYVQADQASAFEKVVEGLAKTRRHGVGTITWYRSLIGTELPAYLVLAPRSNWQQLEERQESFTMWLVKQYGGTSDDANGLASGIIRIVSETWAYRADLSYLPE